MATGIFGSRAISAQESQARTLSITQGQVLGSWDWPMADAINAEADEEYDDDEVLEEDKEDEERLMTVDPNGDLRDGAKVVEAIMTQEEAEPHQESHWLHSE